jgi:CRISPR type I-D-associated protein Csc1
MILETFRLELLDPLYYNSMVDSGAAGAVVTAQWIGDIALMYAINASIGLVNFERLRHDKPSGSPHKPSYPEELSVLPLVTSVARPVTKVRMLPVYDFATSFISEGYFQYEAFERTKNAPFRNWIRKQGLSPGSIFEFKVAYKRKIHLPDFFTVRLGNMRSCLAKVTKIQGDLENEVWGNLYTTRVVHGSLNTITFIKDLPPGAIETFSSQYIIVKGISGSKWIEMITPYE